MQNMIKTVSHRIGGEQLATITFFAPTSLAIWMISFDVVPRTIESMGCAKRHVVSIRFARHTIYNKYILVGKF